MDKSGCKKIIAYLLGTKEDGSDVIGVYPLLLEALRKMCERK